MLINKFGSLPLDNPDYLILYYILNIALNLNNGDN